MSVEDFLLDASKDLVNQGHAAVALTLVHLAKKKAPLSLLNWELGVKLNIETKNYPQALSDIAYVRNNAQFFELDLTAPTVFCDAAIVEIRALQKQETEKVRRAKIKKTLLDVDGYLQFGINKSVSDMSRNVAFIGNCQSPALAKISSYLWDIDHAAGLHVFQEGSYDDIIPLMLESQGSIFLQDTLRQDVKDLVEKFRISDSKVQLFPNIFFRGYMPDLLIRVVNGNRLLSPLGRMNSSIVLYGWVNGLDVDRTVDLFSQETYRKLGWNSFWEAGRILLEDEGAKCGLPISNLFQSWIKQGCFVDDPMHPKLSALIDIGKAIADRDGIEFRKGALENVYSDIDEWFYAGSVWPIYPGFSGPCPNEESMNFLYSEGAYPRVLNLRRFVERSFEIYERDGHSKEACREILGPEFAQLPRPSKSGAKEPSRRKHIRGETPYDKSANYQLWHRSFPLDSTANFSPQATIGFDINRKTKISTAGSCFAQHISRYLASNGYGYFVAEQAPEGLSDAQARDAQYGIFSARYGNIYTARQLVQLFDRAYGRFRPVDTEVWERGDGRIVDPFRPTVELDGFGNVEEMLVDRDLHFAAVRDVFQTCDIFIITLGLTEGWQSQADGAVYPLAPGVAGGEYDPAKHAFINFSYNDVVEDLNSFLTKLREVNEGAKVIFTLSPVPLVATYEDRHVLLSTTYSKSVLRAAADHVSAAHDNAAYFPSYEIITGSYTRGAYYNDDLRTVTEAGVNHVMRVFGEAVGIEEALAPMEKEEDLRALVDRFREQSAIVCDEEEIAYSLAAKDDV